MNLFLLITIIINTFTFTKQISIESNRTSYKEHFNKIFKFEDKIILNYDLNKLRRSLIYGYDKLSRPVINSSNAVTVRVGVNVAQVNGLDDDLQIMVSTLQISMRWNDQFLTWNDSLFSNSIYFRSHEIWVPDVIVKNNVNNIALTNQESLLSGSSISIFDPREKNKYQIKVKPNGDCRWVFPMKLLSNCQLDQRYFPFDTQKCHIDFGSTAYSNDKIILRVFKNKVQTELQKQTEFHLLKSKHIYVNFKETNLGSKYSNESPMTIIRVQLILKRKVIFYMNKIILPYFTFYVVTIFTYVLPVEAGEKKSYCTSILISGMIYLKDTSCYIPKNVDLPLLSVYFNVNLIFIFVCVISSTIIYSIYFMGKTKRPLPKFAKIIITQNWLTKRLNIDQNIKISFSNKSKDFETKIMNLDAKNPKDLKKMKETMQIEMNKLNNELKSLEAYQKSKIQIVDENDIIDLNQSIDMFGTENLMLVKAIKKLIKANENENNRLIEQNRSSFDWFLFIFGFKNNNLKSVKKNKSINKTNCLRNLNYVNNLEKMKSSILKPEILKYDINTSENSTTDNGQDLMTKNGYKYLNKLRYYNHHLNKISSISRKVIINKNEVKLEELDCSDDWKFFAIVIDRLIFLIFSIIIPVCLLLMYANFLLRKPVDFD